MEERILSLEYVNLFRKGRGGYHLPAEEEGKPLRDGTQIKVLFLSSWTFDVQCKAFPIRYGNIYGNKIQIDRIQNTGEHNKMAYFVFDAVKEVWELVYLGCVVFHEQEIRYQEPMEENENN